MNTVAVVKERRGKIIKKYKKVKWKTVIITGMVVALGITVSIAVFEYKALKQCIQVKNELEEQIASYGKAVYVAAEKLPKGTVLTEEMLCKEIRYSDVPLQEFMSEDAVGMTLLFDVPEGTCLMNNMLFQSISTERELFISEVEVAEHLQTGDRIDVRIRYKNAEDYIVLADKIMERCGSGNGMVLHLSEEEILMLASAITDSRDFTGTRLYAAGYPEYEVTAPAQKTYFANHEILALLGRKKQEGESRTALEERLLQEQ